MDKYGASTEKVKGYPPIVFILKPPEHMDPIFQRTIYGTWTLAWKANFRGNQYGSWIRLENGKRATITKAKKIMRQHAIDSIDAVRRQVNGATDKEAAERQKPTIQGQG
jgi:hypothetical protein